MSSLNTQKEIVSCCDCCINKYMHTTSQNVLDVHEGGTDIHFCSALSSSSDELTEWEWVLWGSYNSPVTCLSDMPPGQKKWSCRSTRGSQWMGKCGISLYWNSLFKFRAINIWYIGSLLWKISVVTELTIRVRTEQFLRSWEQAWLRPELEIWSVLALLKLISSFYSSSTWVKLLSHHHKIWLPSCSGVKELICCFQESTIRGVLSLSHFFQDRRDLRLRPKLICKGKCVGSDKAMEGNGIMSRKWAKSCGNAVCLHSYWYVSLLWSSSMVRSVGLYNVECFTE